MNGFSSSQLWLTVLILLLSFYALVAHLINGAQFTIIWTGALSAFGVRKTFEHRKDNPRLPVK